MKDLLTKLQQSEKTWADFLCYAHENGYRDICLSEGVLINITNDGCLKLLNKYELNGLLTSFCDGEGYYVCPRPYHKDIWDATPLNERGEEMAITTMKPSRQEAFEAGIIKVFELMETKGDK